MRDVSTLVVIVIVGLFAAATFAGDSVNTNNTFKSKSFNLRVYGVAEQLEYEDILATESGQLGGAGVEAGFKLVGPLWIEGRGEVFGGTVDHETHLAVRTPSGKWRVSDTTIQMNSEYVGGKVECDLALKFPVTSTFCLKPYVGVGSRSWTRTLDDLTYGVEEDWTTSYGLLGCGGEVGIGKIVKLFGRIEARMPFKNSVSSKYDNYTGMADNESEPHKDPSLYAEAGVNVSVVMASIFVETLEFKEPAPSQQDAKTTMSGVKLGVAF